MKLYTDSDKKYVYITLPKHPSTLVVVGAYDQEKQDIAFFTQGVPEEFNKDKYPELTSFKYDLELTYKATAIILMLDILQPVPIIDRARTILNNMTAIDLTDVLLEKFTASLPDRNLSKFVYLISYVKDQEYIATLKFEKNLYNQKAERVQKENESLRIAIDHAQERLRAAAYTNTIRVVANKLSIVDLLNFSSTNKFVRNLLLSENFVKQYLLQNDMGILFPLKNINTMLILQGYFYMHKAEELKKIIDNKESSQALREAYIKTIDKLLTNKHFLGFIAKIRYVLFDIDGLSCRAENLEQTDDLFAQAREIFGCAVDIFQVGIYLTLIRNINKKILLTPDHELVNVSKTQVQNIGTKVAHRLKNLLVGIDLKSLDQYQNKICCRYLQAIFSLPLETNLEVYVAHLEEEINSHLEASQAPSFQSKK